MTGVTGSPHVDQRKAPKRGTPGNHSSIDAGLKMGSESNANFQKQHRNASSRHTINIPKHMTLVELWSSKTLRTQDWIKISQRLERNLDSPRLQLYNQISYFPSGDSSFVLNLARRQLAKLTREDEDSTRLVGSLSWFSWFGVGFDLGCTYVTVGKHVVVLSPPPTEWMSVLFKLRKPCSKGLLQKQVGVHSFAHLGLSQINKVTLDTLCI